MYACIYRADNRCRRRRWKTFRFSGRFRAIFPCARLKKWGETPVFHVFNRVFNNTVENGGKHPALHPFHRTGVPTALDLSVLYSRRRAATRLGAAAKAVDNLENLRYNTEWYLCKFPLTAARMRERAVGNGCGGRRANAPFAGQRCGACRHDHFVRQGGDRP